MSNLYVAQAEYIEERLTKSCRYFKAWTHLDLQVPKEFKKICLPCWRWELVVYKGSKAPENLSIYRAIRNKSM